MNNFKDFLSNKNPTLKNLKTNYKTLFKLIYYKLNIFDKFNIF